MTPCRRGRHRPRKSTGPVSGAGRRGRALRGDRPRPGHPPPAGPRGLLIAWPLCTAPAPRSHGHWSNHGGRRAREMTSTCEQVAGPQEMRPSCKGLRDLGGSFPETTDGSHMRATSGDGLCPRGLALGPLPGAPASEPVSPLGRFVSGGGCSGVSLAGAPPSRLSELRAPARPCPSVRPTCPQTPTAPSTSV